MKLQSDTLSQQQQQNPSTLGLQHFSCIICVFVEMCGCVEDKRIPFFLVHV